MPRLLVITGELPVASETFVIGHIQGFMSRGWEVAVAANTVDRDRLPALFETVPRTFELEPRAAEIRSKGTLGRWWALRSVLASSVM